MSGYWAFYRDSNPRQPVIGAPEPYQTRSKGSWRWWPSKDMDMWLPEEPPIVNSPQFNAVMDILEGYFYHEKYSQLLLGEATIKIIRALTRETP